ncbi:hypothetical protein JM658_08170 [Joostella atrarenae]|uniref:Uncharacterized protein n=1 Tax=Joostella atrarenae TaxID=679257 RepID=A0ABS9J302_9FLAO|nr:hypothetical protein [Joostella atrarenae]MCF8714802.1 hypothetical protein [Joostella atrarenae]
MKPDSIIKNLKPLEIYIGDSIQYDSIFKLKTAIPENFSFIEKKTSIASRQPFAINFSSINVSRKNTILHSIELKEFMKILPSIRYNDNYDGLITFRNLFFSSNGKKAYFEIYYFKGKQNAGSRAIYAEWRNGKWEYQSLPISIS